MMQMLAGRISLSTVLLLMCSSSNGQLAEVGNIQSAINGGTTSNSVTQRYDDTNVDHGDPSHVSPEWLRTATLTGDRSTGMIRGTPSGQSSFVDVDIWPFNHKNKTADNNNNTDPSNKTDTSCHAHSTCQECSDASSWCHWCAHDHACHSKGSIYGCFSGSSCDSDDGNNDDKKHDNKDHTSGCASHNSCSECTLSSHLCHWCAHDNACHAIGSLYGCATGVDCYSNDRCQRTDPEQIIPTAWTSITIIPLIGLLSVALLIVCCLTMCHGVATGIKGAYDDLAILTLTTASHNDENDNAPPPRTAANAPRRMMDISAGGADPDQPTTTTVFTTDSSTATEKTLTARGATADAEGTHPAAGDDSLACPESEQPSAHAEDLPTAPLLPTAAQFNGSHNVSSARSASRRNHHHRRHPQHMQRLCRACTIFYVVSVLVIVATVMASLWYFPAMPQYNVCNDAVAWKQLIDNLVSAKVEADFEILVSLTNPNRIALALDKASGHFAHDNTVVGSFDIPPVVVPAMSIQDVLMVAHLEPSKWDALSLVAEYYRGKLVLHVDAKATVRVPIIFDYDFELKLDDVVVRVNDLSDRHLCHCPSWNQSRNKTLIAPDPGMAGMGWVLP